MANKILNGYTIHKIKGAFTPYRIWSTKEKMYVSDPLDERQILGFFQCLAVQDFLSIMNGEQKDQLSSAITSILEKIEPVSETDLGRDTGKRLVHPITSSQKSVLRSLGDRAEVMVSKLFFGF